MKDLAKVQSKKNRLIFIAGVTVLVTLIIVSLFVGKYPLSLKEMIAGNQMHIKVFINLRLSRVIVGVCGGFALGVAGYVYQIVFRNPLASPDIIGVSSGASAGAAFGILFFHGALSVTLASFGGALIAVVFSLFLSSLDRTGKKSTVVLAGIAVHSLAQTVLMSLKLLADPEKELASIEYWIMGSLNGISIYSIWWNIILIIFTVSFLFLLHRQTILLSGFEGETKFLGVDVTKQRFIVLLLATITVSSVVSMTGLISFVGLLAPHVARKLFKKNSLSTFVFGGIIGAIVLTGADILARSVADTELPVSIFTSLLGAPFLVFLIVKGRKEL